MTQTKTLVCLIAACLLFTALPQQASGQRGLPRIFRPPPPKPVVRSSTSIVESPFRALGEGTGRIPPRNLRDPFRQGAFDTWPGLYRPGFPTSEIDLDTRIRQIELMIGNRRLSGKENWLTKYLGPSLSITEASKEDIKQHQKMLKSLGYYSSTIDGIEGPKTQEAVSGFLNDNFPNFPDKVLIDNYASDLADPKITSLISLSYDLAASARIIHRLDRDNRLALINRSRSILGYAEAEESMDIYVASKQLTEVEEKQEYVINDPAKGRSYDVPVQPANLIVVRYYPKRTRKKFEILSGTAATAHFYEHLVNQVRRSNQNRTIALVPVGKGAHVVTADGILYLTAKEVTSLKRGIVLNSAHPLSSEITKAQGKPLIIYNHPLSQKSRGWRQTIGQIAYGLQRSYPQTRIVRSDFSAATALENISALMKHEVSTPEDVVVVIDRGSDRVQTFGAIENSRSKLQDSGVQIVDYTPGKKWEGGQKKSLIVITGHINERLAKLVEKLCEDGYFAGNFVVFNSCYELTGLSTRLVETLRQTGGARAVFRFNTQIHPLKVTEFLDGIAETLKPRQPISLFDLIFKNLPRSMSGGWEAYYWHNTNKDRSNAGD